MDLQAILPPNQNHVERFFFCGSAFLCGVGVEVEAKRKKDN